MAMLREIAPTTVRLIVDNLVMQERQAADDLHAAELRLRAARAAVAEARQKFGLAA